MHRTQRINRNNHTNRMIELIRRPLPDWYADIPSALFLLAVVTNTVLICRTSALWLLAPLTMLQTLLMVGCQEAKHLSVHGTFFRHRGLNDAVGIICAGMFGVNFIAYRYFHFAHHRATCSETDPEGRLYSLSWRTRWIWLLAPLELPWVAWHIGRIAWAMVPAHKHWQRNAVVVWMTALGIAAVVGLCLAPAAVTCCYLIPLSLFAWFDFVLTQAEHYGVAIVPAAQARDARTISHDIVLPFGLGWLTLHRGLHRVHHGHPALRWFLAPRALKRDRTAAPLSYGAFARRWFTGGPRLWLNAQGEPANAMVSALPRSTSRS
jgi:fatty acid desaturase